MHDMKARVVSGLPGLHHSALTQSGSDCTWVRNYLHTCPCIMLIQLHSTLVFFALVSHADLLQEGAAMVATAQSRNKSVKAPAYLIYHFPGGVQ